MRNISTPIDCILIPGGGLTPDGNLPAWTRARLDRAYKLASNTRWIALLSGGTVHKPPPIDQAGFPVFESRRAAIYLIQKGVPPGQIATEISSYDTIGNGLFSRLQIVDPLELSRLHVITSEFHLPRTRAVFEWVYHLQPQTRRYQLEFEGTPDEGLQPQALAARRSREFSSLEQFIQTSRKISSLPAALAWLYREHRAYAPGSSVEPLSPSELESY